MASPARPVESVIETVGSTPLVELQAHPPSVDVYAKLESFNPGASVKDRIGVYMIQQMLADGTLEPGGTVIEPTAGNTGIALAIAANQLGVEAVFVVPARFSVEKQALMRALGAEIVTTPTEAGMSLAVERAHELAAEREGAAVPEQFSNPLNTEAHYHTTGPEIYDALDDRVGAVVAGCGTAGTLMGIARYGGERPDPPYVVATEPEGSLFGAFHGRDPDAAEYKTEGIGTHDPSINDLYEPERVDELLTVADRDTHDELRRLAEEEGHLVGSSSAVNSLGARAIADRIADGTIDVAHPTVVTVFPDSSERYLSKGIYGSFEEWGD